MLARLINVDDGCSCAESAGGHNAQHEHSSWIEYEKEKGTLDTIIPLINFFFRSISIHFFLSDEMPILIPNPTSILTLFPLFHSIILSFSRPKSLFLSPTKISTLALTFCYFDPLHFSSLLYFFYFYICILILLLTNIYI